MGPDRISLHQQGSLGAQVGVVFRTGQLKSWTAVHSTYLLRHKPSCSSPLGAWVKAALLLEAVPAGLDGGSPCSPPEPAEAPAAASPPLSGSLSCPPLLPASCFRRRRISRAAATAATTAAATTTPTIAQM